MSGDIRLLYITTASAEEAETIAAALLDARLIACANLLPSVKSFYRWEGETHVDTETLLLCKTTAERVESAIAQVRTLHSYQCPCITVLPVVGGNGDYLEWVTREIEG